MYQYPQVFTGHAETAADFVAVDLVVEDHAKHVPVFGRQVSNHVSHLTPGLLGNQRGLGAVVILGDVRVIGYV
jgi:hypothetical protein